LSRIFKSEDCIEALPCRLEPISEVAFFNNNNINDEVSDQDDNEVDIETVVELEPVEPPVDPPKVAEEIIQNAQNEAAQLLDSARNQVEQLLAEAKLQVDTIKDNARQEGFAQGKEEGLSQIRQELNAQLMAALLLLNEAELERERRILDSETELLKLAQKIAEKIIGMELQSNTAQVQTAVAKQALAKIAGANKIKVRIHPDSLKSLTDQNLADLQSVFSEPKPIQIEADPNIAAGGCYIESEQGNVDARLQIQLEKILTELLKVGQLR
jgi:flagellar assembly protein FliH